MFNSAKPTNQQPNMAKPTFGKQMGKGSPNANIDRPGTFKGTKKAPGKTSRKIQAPAPIAPSNSFGQAKTIASGKKNFSRGAPGHQSGK